MLKIKLFTTALEGIFKIFKQDQLLIVRASTTQENFPINKIVDCICNNCKNERYLLICQECSRYLTSQICCEKCPNIFCKCKPRDIKPK